MFWTFLCPVRKVYTDSMFNISKTFKKKTNIIERKKEANTLKAVWIFYCLKANRCGLTNILNLYLLNSCCYMYSCPCRYYIEKKIWVWLEKKLGKGPGQYPFIWSGCQIKFFTCVMFFLPNVIQTLFLNPAKDLEIRLYLFTSNIQYESFLDDCIFQTFHSIFLLEQIQCCRVHNFIPSSFLD